jgi:hypothetical protein
VRVAFGQASQTKTFFINTRVFIFVFRDPIRVMHNAKKICTNYLARRRPRTEIDQKRANQCQVIRGTRRASDRILSPRAPQKPVHPMAIAGAMRRRRRPTTARGNLVATQ